MSETAVDQVLCDKARALCPSLRIDGTLHRTDKAIVLAGVLHGQDVVVKLLVDADPFWQGKFAHEISTYRSFALAPPPVPAPRLLAADPDAGVLVATRLPGVPVARDRYSRRLLADGAAPLLQAARALQAWTAPDGVFAQVWDYPARLRRYRVEYQLLTDHDEAALNALAAAAGPMRLAHGDLLPANVLRDPGGVLTGVLDWEFTGWFLPGLDAALLWILLGRTPGAREQAEQISGGTLPQRAGFWANVATLLVRELRTHGELPDGPLRTERLAYLRTAWGTAQARVHELAGQL
jgi:hypothetical protein